MSRRPPSDNPRKAAARVKDERRRQPIPLDELIDRKRRTLWARYSDTSWRHR